MKANVITPSIPATATTATEARAAPNCPKRGGAGNRDSGAPPMTGAALASTLAFREPSK